METTESNTESDGDNRGQHTCISTTMKTESEIQQCSVAASETKREATTTTTTTTTKLLRRQREKPPSEAKDMEKQER